MSELLTANETRAMYAQNEDAKSDRKAFVHNLGVLLSQTREGIIGATLSDDEIVSVKYRDGYVQCVNVNMDSYMAIIRDVTKHL